MIVFQNVNKLKCVHNFTHLDLRFTATIYGFHQLYRAAEGGQPAMDDSSYRLNIDLGKKNEIHQYS